MPPTMRELPTTTRTKIRSTQILTSLPQIVSELVQNSLDAGASHIELGVDCEEWSCWVRDNGEGVSREGLKLLSMGSEEGRYASSKAYDPASLGEVSTFGFRGEALASASELCCLEISSRTSQARETWSVILKGGSLLYDGPSVRWRRQSQGTVVYVRDAFYNVPVRRTSHAPRIKSLETIRRDLECFALMFPGVSFTLEDISQQGEAGPSKGGSRILSIPKTSSTLGAFRNIFGRALTEHVEEVNVTWEDLKLDGFISLEGAHGKAYQFLYLNRHILAPCNLHRLIDSRFASSSFGKNAFDELGESSLPRSTVRRSPRKTERRPVYCLNLTISPSRVDNCLDPGKSIVQFTNADSVSSFLVSLVDDFLFWHGFATGRSRKVADDAPSSPTKRRRLDLPVEWDVGSFNALSHTRPLFRGVAQTTDAVDPMHASTVGNSLSKVPSEHTHDGIVEWTDPVTNQAFVVDTRTGFSRPKIANQHNDTHDDRPALLQSSLRRSLPSTSWLKKEKDPTGNNAHNEAMPKWLQDALHANVVYVPAQATIPEAPAFKAHTIDEQATRVHSGSTGCRRRHQGEMADYLGRSKHAVADLEQFSKAQLARAHVIGQADAKFIACLLDVSDVDVHQSLVLIDQHAADERVRVERFLEDLCWGFLQHGKRDGGGVDVEILEPPRPILLTRHEATMLNSSEDLQHAFNRWGIRFCEVILEPSSSQELYCQVLVEAVPSVVSEKLLLGNELRELVKSHLNQLMTDGSLNCAAIPDTSEKAQSWQQALRCLPAALLDIVNSKACRGAIMFNDPLTVEQCQRLVLQLSATSLPFQCAHGRPSLAPLTSVRNHAAPSRPIDWSRLGGLASSMIDHTQG